MGSVTSFGKFSQHSVKVNLIVKTAFSKIEANFNLLLTSKCEIAINFLHLMYAIYNERRTFQGRIQRSVMGAELWLIFSHKNDKIVLAKKT